YIALTPRIFQSICVIERIQLTGLASHPNDSVYVRRSMAAAASHSPGSGHQRTLIAIGKNGLPYSLKFLAQVISDNAVATPIVITRFTFVLKTVAGRKKMTKVRRYPEIAKLTTVLVNFVFPAAAAATMYKACVANRR